MLLRLPRCTLGAALEELYFIDPALDPAKISPSLRYTAARGLVFNLPIQLEDHYICTVCSPATFLLLYPINIIFILECCCFLGGDTVGWLAILLISAQRNSNPERALSICTHPLARRISAFIHAPGSAHYL
jgi:hypothetical protein